MIDYRMLKSKTIIVYGTGERAESAINHLKNNGLIEEVRGFTNSFIEEEDVLLGKTVYPLQKVLLLFEDAFFYISPIEPVKSEIIASLTQIGIPIDRIINATVRFLSCDELQKGIIIATSGLVSCCAEPGKNKPFESKWDDFETLEVAIGDYWENRNKNIELLKSNEGACGSCTYAKVKPWSKDQQIEIVNIGLYYPCQLSCCYCNWICNAAHKNSIEKKKRIEKAQNIDVGRVIRYMEEQKMFSKEGLVSIASGEFTLANRRDEVLELIGEHKLAVLTNGIFFNEKIAKMTARNDGSYLNVSLDAGTKQTYFEVKGLNVFERVCENLLRYKSFGSNIQLKYIFLESNISEENIIGFINIVKRIKPSVVIVSFDYNLGRVDIDERIVLAISKMIRLLDKLNIQYSFVDALGKENIDNIKKYI